MTTEQARPALAGWARVAYEAWATMAPTAFGLIQDPSRHFSMLGQQAEARVEDLMTQMMGPDRPSESPLDKAGRLTQARMAAGEIVRVDLEPPEFLREEPDETPTTPAEVAEDRLDQETSALRELQMTGSTRYFLLPWVTEMPDPIEEPDLYQRVLRDKQTQHETQAEELEEARRRRERLVQDARAYLGLS